MCNVYLENVTVYFEKCSKHVFKTNAHHVFEKCPTCIKIMFHVGAKNVYCILRKSRHVLGKETDKNWQKKKKKSKANQK